MERERFYSTAPNSESAPTPVALIRTTFYFATGREQSSHDCATILEAFERCERMNMDALAFPVGSERGISYVWRPGAENTLEAFEARMNELAALPKPVVIPNSQEPSWDLLEHAVEQAGLPLSVCAEFMWMGEWIAGEHSYKHRDTRKYVRLTKSTCAPQLLVREARNG